MTIHNLKYKHSKKCPAAKVVVEEVEDVQLPEVLNEQEIKQEVQQEITQEVEHEVKPIVKAEIYDDNSEHSKQLMQNYFQHLKENERLQRKNKFKSLLTGKLPF